MAARSNLDMNLCPELSQDLDVSRSDQCNSDNHELNSGVASSEPGPSLDTVQRYAKVDACASCVVQGLWARASPTAPAKLFLISLFPSLLGRSLTPQKRAPNTMNYIENVFGGTLIGVFITSLSAHFSPLSFPVNGY